MVILSVDLKDFLSHRESKIDFEDGLIAIVGPNGAGKSSIVDAIAYALVNEAVSRNINKRELIRKGARAASVKLHFTIGGKEYVVERKISDGIIASDATLYEVVSREGREQYRILAKKINAVNKVIEQIFEMNKDVMKEIVFVPQGRLTEIIDMSRSQRRDFAKKLLKINDMDRAYARILEALREFESETNNIMLEYEKIKTKVSEMKKKKNELTKLKQELEIKMKENEEVQHKLSEMLEELSHLESKREKYISLILEKKNKEETLRRLKDEKKLYERELSQLPYTDPKEVSERMHQLDELLKKEEEVREQLNIIIQIENLERRIETLEKDEERIEKLLRQREDEISKIEKLEHEREEIRKKLERARELSTEVKRLRKALSELERLLEGYDIDEYILLVDDLSKEIIIKKEKLEELRKEKEAIEGRIIELKRILGLLKNQTKCPVCGRELSPVEIKRIRGNYLKELKELQARLNSITEEISSLQNEIEKIEDRIKIMNNNLGRAEAILMMVGEGVDVETLRTLLKEKEEELSNLGSLETLQHKLTCIDRNLTTLKKQEKEIQSTIEMIQRRLGEVEALRKQREELLKKISLDKEEIQRLHDQIVNAKKEKEALQKLVVRLAEITSALARLNDQIVQLELEIARIEAELRKLDFDEKKYEEHKRQVESLRLEKERLTAEIEKLKALIDKTMLEVKDLEKLKEKLSVLEAELRSRREFKQFIEVFKSDLRNEIPSRVMEYFREAWSVEGSSIINMFDSSVSSIEVTKEWDLVALTSSGRTNVGALSGGERVVVALAMRIALSRVLAGNVPEFVVLDEPTVYLDSEKRRALKTVLTNISRNALRQVIVVTHDRELVDVADFTIEVRKSGDTSIVSVLND